jgi:uncharacterized ferredoxin-like protein
MLREEKEFKLAAIERIAEEMCLAARTAPKGKGVDLLEMAVIKAEEIEKLSKKMREIGERETNSIFIRDSDNILQASVIVLIGTKLQVIGLKYCSYCGKENCAEAEKTGTICAFNIGDLGIAVGSAVSVAMDHRLDNRIMFSIGKAALELELLEKEVKLIYGIPLSVSSKNPFFDRMVLHRKA